MKYTYRTATETIEVEVDEQYHGILLELDREETNADRKHSRRHPVSLSNADYDGEWFEDETDWFSALIDADSIDQAMSFLPERQRHLLMKYIIDGWSYSDIAAHEGVTEGAIRHAIERAKKQLCKVLRDPSENGLPRGYKVKA